MFILMAPQNAVGNCIIDVSHDVSGFAFSILHNLRVNPHNHESGGPHYYIFGSFYDSLEANIAITTIQIRSTSYAV